MTVLNGGPRVPKGFDMSSYPTAYDFVPAVLVRQVTRPVMSERELRESTKYEAERFLPYSVDEAQIDAKILGKADDGQNMDVLVDAAQKDLVLSQASAIQFAGLSAGVVE